MMMTMVALIGDDSADNCHDHKRVDGVCPDQTALAFKANMNIWLTLFSLGDTWKRGQSTFLKHT